MSKKLIPWQEVADRLADNGIPVSLRTLRRWEVEAAHATYRIIHDLSKDELVAAVQAVIAAWDDKPTGFWFRLFCGDELTEVDRAIGALRDLVPMPVEEAEAG